ncbi:MAG TPA: metal-sensitive transcriptional regulator [Candidatus Deferrimicrobium sp.]|nr:metal-sensitive transcriptional regulator [Candidatus Deferrimicrobium sp.]
MHPYSQSKEDLIRRLRKIEGQVKGIQRMVDSDTYCVDVLVQIAAVRAAINKVGTIIFEQHTRGCVKSAIENNKGEEMVEELIDVITKFVR